MRSSQRAEKRLEQLVKELDEKEAELANPTNTEYEDNSLKHRIYKIREAITEIIRNIL